MITTALTTSRRTLLTRGLTLLATVAGMGAAMPARSTPPDPEGAVSLSLYGERRPAICHSPSGQQSVAGRVMRTGELFDRPQGERIGEFFAHSFSAVTPLGPQFRAASTTEIQTFVLSEGSLIAIGGVVDSSHRERVYAIVGGTGRFEGARGSCIERQGDGSAAARIPVEFVVSLLV